MGIEVGKGVERGKEESGTGEGREGGDKEKACKD